MRRLILAVGVACLLLAACGSGSGLTVASVTQYWRQTVSEHYYNGGVVARGDGRGCVKTAAGHYSCTAYVRNAENSYSTGLSVIGTVVIQGGNMTARGHLATGSEMQQWFAKTGGGINP
jgi:hypothetical protein